MRKTSLALAITLGAALSGTFHDVSAQQSRQATQQQRQTADEPVEYAASFKNTDITEFIQVVGRNLGRTIIIDPDVRGRIEMGRSFSYGPWNPKELRKSHDTSRERKPFWRRNA